jgi:hypothetical protein
MAPDGSRHQDPTDDEELLELLHESACRVPLPNMGDAICFDSRTLHCATANVSTQRRVLLYVSLAARSWHGRAWRGVGFDRPGTLLNELRGKYYLSADGLRLVQIRQEVGISAKISAWVPRRIVLAAARLCLCLCQCMRACWALVGACLSTTVTATRFGCMPLHQTTTVTATRLRLLDQFVEVLRTLALISGPTQPMRYEYTTCSAVGI